MKRGQRGAGIYWQILDSPPVTDRWQRHVLLLLAKRQDETGQSVTMTPQELARTGFSARQAAAALHNLVLGGHIWETGPDRFWVKRPPRHQNWSWKNAVR